MIRTTSLLERAVAGGTQATNMRKVIYWLGILALVGCEPAPSTPLAPDKPPLNIDSMSKEEQQKLIQADEARRAAGQGPVAQRSSSQAPEKPGSSR